MDMRILRTAFPGLGGPAVLALCVLGGLPVSAVAEEATVWTVGPVVQYQFGERNHGWTFGIEAAYWWMKPGTAAPWEAPAGLDAGLEFSRDKFRIYSEYQTGFIVAGLSAGPYLEIGYFSEEDEHPGIRAGFQYGPWGWWFAGLNLRMRSGPDETYLSPGIFAKFFDCSGGDCFPTFE